MDINSLEYGPNFASSISNDLVNASATPIAQDISDEKASSDSQINLDRGLSLAKESTQTVDNELEVATAVAEVSSFVRSKNQDLTFSYDEESNRSIIKVTDASSGDVIRQIPSEEVVKLSERIKELQSDVGESIGLGVLLNNQV